MTIFGFISVFKYDASLTLDYGKIKWRHSRQLHTLLYVQFKTSYYSYEKLLTCMPRACVFSNQERALPKFTAKTRVCALQVCILLLCGDRHMFSIHSLMVT